MRLSLNPNTPATLGQNTAQLTITEDFAPIAFVPHALSLPEGSSTELTVQATTTPLGIINLTLSILGSPGSQIINIQPTQLQLSPSQQQAKVTITVPDDRQTEISQQSTVRLNIVSGPGPSLRR